MLIYWMNENYEVFLWETFVCLLHYNCTEEVAYLAIVSGAAINVSHLTEFPFGSWEGRGEGVNGPSEIKSRFVDSDCIFPRQWRNNCFRRSLHSDVQSTSKRAHPRKFYKIRHISEPGCTQQYKNRVLFSPVLFFSLFFAPPLVLSCSRLQT